METTAKKKSYNLDEELIKKVRHLYNVKTDTEAIHMALQKTVEDKEIEAALDTLLEKGHFRNVYS